MEQTIQEQPDGGFRRDALLSLLARGGVTGANYLSVALISRTVPVSDFGLVSFILSAQVTIAILIELGLGDAMTHYASYYFGRREPSQAYRVYKLVLAIKIGLNGLVLAAAFGLSRLLAAQIYQDDALALPLLSGFILACGTSFQSYFLGTFRSERRYGLLAVALLGQYGGQVVLLVLIWGWRGMSVTGVVAAYLGGFAIFGLVAGTNFPWRRVIRASLPADRPAWRGYLQFWKWLAVSNITLAFLLPINVLILQLYQPSEEIARYYSAFRAVQLFWIMDQVLAFVLLPKLSEILGEQGVAGVRRLLARLLLGVWSLGLALGVSMALAAGPLIRLLYGPGYENAIPILYLLIPVGILYLGYNTGNMALISLRRTDLGAKLGLVAAVLSLSANFILAPRLGAAGAAIAALLTFGVQAVGVWLLVRLVIRQPPVGTHESIFKAAP